MSQSQYFPKSQTFGACTSSHPGFDFHAHLGKIVANQKKTINHLRYKAKSKDVARVLTNIVIAYNMMSGSELESIETEFKSMKLIFPLDGAIDALADLFDTCADDHQISNLITSIPNRKNLYKGLLLDFICKTESVFSASACFDLTQEMPTDALKRQRKLILEMRKVLNINNGGGTPVSGFEAEIGKRLSKLGTRYKVKNNVYDPNLCCEIDFVVTPSKGTVARIEADGYLHFNQNFHGHSLTQDLNGLTRMQTNLLRKFGRVLRISGACNSGEYHKRINSIFDIFKKFDASQDRVRFLPDGGEYRTCK